MNSGLIDLIEKNHKSDVEQHLGFQFEDRPIYGLNMRREKLKLLAPLLYNINQKPMFLDSPDQL